MSLRRAWSLTEMVIVVLILGILASVAAPRILGVNKQAAETRLRQDLALVRSAIDRFAADNNGIYPAQDGKDATFKAQLAPYLGFGRFPKDPFDDDAQADVVKGRNQGDPLADQLIGTFGWLYDNQTGEFIANTSTLSSDGVTPYCQF
jgi:general secretion pathway protein G